MVTAITYIYSGYSSNMEVSRVTLACGSPSNGSNSCGRGQAQSWGVTRTPPVSTLHRRAVKVSLWPPLPFSVIWNIHRVRPCPVVSGCSVSNFHVDVYGRNSRTVPSPDAGPPAGHQPRERLPRRPGHPGGRDPGIPLNLRGSSKPFSVAVSKRVFASRCPFVLTCQHVNVSRTRASAVSPQAPSCVRGACRPKERTLHRLLLSGLCCVE